jgi:hypothetical protein
MTAIRASLRTQPFGARVRLAGVTTRAAQRKVGAWCSSSGNDWARTRST